MAIFISTVIKTLSLLAIFFLSFFNFLHFISHSPEQYLTLTDTILCNIYLYPFNEMTTIPLFIWALPCSCTLLL